MGQKHDNKYKLYAFCNKDEKRTNNMALVDTCI